jgi:hypothetical protein
MQARLETEVSMAWMSYRSPKREQVQTVQRGQLDTEAVAVNAERLSPEIGAVAGQLGTPELFGRRRQWHARRAART